MRLDPISKNMSSHLGLVENKDKILMLTIKWRKDKKRSFCVHQTFNILHTTSPLERWRTVPLPPYAKYVDSLKLNHMKPMKVTFLGEW